MNVELVLANNQKNKVYIQSFVNNAEFIHGTNTNYRSAKYSMLIPISSTTSFILAQVLDRSVFRIGIILS